MRAYWIVVALLTSAIVATADSVTVSPPNPTTGDALTFDLYMQARCCQSRYYGDTATVSGTTINLSYEYDDSLCQYALCLVAGDRNQFRCDPLAAGTYDIYQTAQAYCAGPICPLGPIMQMHVGRVTVTRPVSVEAPSSHFAQRPTGAQTRLALRGGQLSVESLSAGSAMTQRYSVTGRRVGMAASRTMDLRAGR